MKEVDAIDYKKYSRSNLKLRTKNTILPSESMDKLLKNQRLLDKCRMYYDSLRDFRQRSERNFNFYRGKQWSDKFKGDDGNWVTEEQYLNSQGRPALVQNLIRQVTNNLIGQYRNSTSKSVVISRTPEGQKQSEMMSCAMEAVQQFNLTKELDARNFEEFALSGAPFQKLSYAYLKERNKPDIFIENIDPRRMFWNSDVRDIRFIDLRLIGQIIDIDIETLISQFAKTQEDEAKIRQAYSYVQDEPLNTRMDSRSGNNIDFFTPTEPDKCRVFEVWHLVPRWRLYVHDEADGTYQIVKGTMKDVAMLNEARIYKATSMGVPEDEVPLLKGQEKKELSWFVTYLTPDAYVLQEHETPYDHQEHPYSFLLYPLIRGEVWGFIEDLIPNNKLINRLIVLDDFIMNTSAKNTLLIPEECLNGKEPEEFADEYRKVGGIIVYTPSKAGHIPMEIKSNSINMGINEKVALHMQLLQEVAGVSGAAQGQQASSGTPARRYAMEAQNSTINVIDKMESYSMAKQRRDLKILKLIKQYYNERQFISVAGRDYSEEAKSFDPEVIKDIAFDVIISNSNDTPAFRGLIDDTLMKLFELGAIDAEMYLENTTAPFASKLLEAIQKRKTEMTQGAPGNIDPNLIQGAASEAQAQADPRLQGMIQQAVA